MNVSKYFKSHILFFIFFSKSLTLLAQDETVKVRRAQGAGTNREAALKMAYEDALGQAFNTELLSRFQMYSSEHENYIRNILRTKTTGVIKSRANSLDSTYYEGKYTVIVIKDVIVSKTAFDANVNSLADMLGDIKFAVIKDINLHQNDSIASDIISDKLNEVLTRNHIEHLQSSLLVALQTNNLTNKLSLDKAAAEYGGTDFIIKIKSFALNETFKENKPYFKPIITLSLFDASTNLDIITTDITSISPICGENRIEGLKKAVAAALNQGFTSQLLDAFYTKVADWCNEGSPYEVIFLGTEINFLDADAIDSFKLSLENTQDHGRSGSKDFNPLSSKTWFYFKDSKPEVQRIVSRTVKSVNALSNYRKIDEYGRKITFCKQEDMREVYDKLRPIFDLRNNAAIQR